MAGRVPGHVAARDRARSRRGRIRRLRQQAKRRAEWGTLAVMTAMWLLLVAVGLGKNNLLFFGALLLASAMVFAWFCRSTAFGIAATVVAALGVSTYGYIFIRAGFGPAINMGDASTWDALSALIARQQYPPRTPWDNPIFLPGPNNPGRTLELIWLQIANYIQYFDWQWSRGVAAANSYMAWPRLPITLTFLSLGVYGANVLYRRDRSVFWLLLCYFSVTGPGLVAYMNFKPGFSIGYEAFPVFNQHEVRERDYFYLLSFQVWGMWSGIGIAWLFRKVREWLSELGLRSAMRNAIAAVPYCLAFLPFVLNQSSANRDREPEASLPIDYAYNLLQSVEPYGVLITGGDNDTYPLWYAQEVLGIRQDVTVVVTTLVNMDWQIRHIRDREVQPFDPDQAPWYATSVPASVPPPPISWTDEQIENARPFALGREAQYRAGNLVRTLPAGTPLHVQDQVFLQMALEGVGRRSIYFSSSAESSIPEFLRDSIVREGLALRLYTESAPALHRLGMGADGYPVDIERTDTLANEVFRYTRLFETDMASLGTTERGPVSDLGIMFLSLGTAYDSIGDRRRSIENLQKALHLMPENSRLDSYLSQIRPSQDDSDLDSSARRSREVEAIQR